MKRNAPRAKRQDEMIDLGELTVVFHPDDVTFVVKPGLMGATINDPAKLMTLRNRISMWQATKRARDKRNAGESEGAGAPNHSNGTGERSATD